MKKSCFVAATGLLCFLIGCSSILIRPAVDDVKKIAIVSVYMNRDFYNTKSPRGQEGENAFANLVGGVVKKAAGDVWNKLSEEKEQNQIITYGLKVNSEQLTAVGRWKLVPVTNVLQSEVYKRIMEPDVKGSFAKGFITFLQEERKSHWITPEGMHYIPISAVAQSGTHRYYGDAKDPTEDAKKALAKLCKDLKVDGVALVELDMGYRFGKLAKVTIGKTTQAKPSVSSALVIVTKNGEIAVNTGFITRGAGERYEGNSAGMVRNDKLFLKHKDNKIVEVFNQAIEKSAIAMEKKLAKAFDSLK